MVKTKELVNPLRMVNQLTPSTGLTKSSGNVLLLVNPSVVCDDDFFAFLCSHSVLEFPAVNVCKVKKPSYFFAVVVGYQPKVFALFHVLCKPFVVKAGVKMSSFAIKLRTGGAVVGRV